MRPFFAIWRRELVGYFATPLALVFTSVFLVAGAAACFYLGGFFDLGQAELTAFFRFVPWLYLFFLPALSMRLWAEERRLGTWDLLLSLPVPLLATVLAKFLAAWTLALMALALSAPLWFTISWLGEPDHGVVLAGYLGSALLAGCYLAIGTCLSALTRNQLIAFIVTVAVCFLFMLAGLSFVLDFVKDWVSAPVLDLLAAFSFLPYFRTMIRGLIDARALIFFGGVIVVWLAAAAIAVDRQRFLGGAPPRYGWLRRIAPLSAFVLLGVIFLSGNLLAHNTLRQARWDLTEPRLFTLSEGTHRMLRQLEEPIALQFFFSHRQASNWPWLTHYARRVEDLLEEMAMKANGKIVLTRSSPAPFSPQEDEALALGINGQNNGEGELIYFGLAGSNAVDTVEVIPIFAPEREFYLEYDLARLIHNLDTPRRAVVGVISNLPLDTGHGGIVEAMEGRSQPFLIYRELVDRFDVRFLERELVAVPADVDVLLLAHPRPLAAHAAYAVDQFVMRGGRVLAFVDPYSEVSLTAGPQGQPLPGATRMSALPRLFASWGVAMDEAYVVADAGRAQRVRQARDDRRAFADYLLWLGLTPAELNRDSLMTASLDRLNLASVGALRIAPPPDVTVTPLVTSSGDAGLLASSFAFTRPAPDELRRNFVRDEDAAPYVIAAQLSGQFASAFADDPPPLPDDAPPGTSRPPHLAVADAPANLVVFADSDIFDDRFWVELRRFADETIAVPMADNAQFLLNAIEVLTGSDELIGLRGREASDRPFTRLNEVRRAAEARFLEEEEAVYQRVRVAEQALRGLDEAGALSEDAARRAAEYRAELVGARQALRSVQQALREDIERITNWVTALNLLAMPALLLLVWFVLPWLLRRRRRHLPPRLTQG